MARIALTFEETLPLLAATPQRLAELTAGLTPVQLRTAPVAGEWSVRDVLAHLRSCADMWGGSIVTMLGEDYPTIRATDPRNWVVQTNYHDLEFEPSFRAFVAQRAELLALLEPLPPDSWSRSGTFTGAGAPLERTVLHQAARLAIHERPHIKQIGRIAAAMR